jgi:hypothetical protein
MRKFLIEDLSKTRLRNPIGTERKYYVPGSPVGSKKELAEILSTTFYGNQTNQLLVEKPTWDFVQPEGETNFLLAEDGNILMTENNNNLEV